MAYSCWVLTTNCCYNHPSINLKTMCNYKILTENSNGHVLLCLDCNHIQIGFGTSLVSCSEEDLFDFILQTRNVLKGNKHTNNVTEKRIYLSVYSANTRMALSLSELEMLTEMLNTAANMLVVYNLLYKQN